MNARLRLGWAAVLFICSMTFAASGLCAGSSGVAQVENQDDLFATLTASPSLENAKKVLLENERYVTKELWNKLSDEADKLNNASTFARALQICESMVLVAERLSDSKRLAYSYEQLATIHLARQDHGMAKASAIHSLSIGEGIKDYPRIASTCSMLGFISQNIGDYEVAISYLRRSLEVCKEAEKQPDVEDDNKIVFIDALLDLGFIFRTQGKYSEAFGHLMQALEIAKQKGSREFQLRRANSLRNISAVFADQGDYNKALGYVSDAIVMMMYWAKGWHTT